jgi:hypothetical protein
MEALQKELSAKVAACEDGRQADVGAIRRTAETDRWGRGAVMEAVLICAVG